MSALQDELAAAEYNASAGGGAVEVTVNGSHEIKADVYKRQRLP